MLRPGPGRRGFFRPWDGLLLGLLRGHGWSESYQFTTVPFGKHGGKHQLWRGTGRWRRSDAGYHVTGNPVGHLLTYPRIELCCTGQELAGNVGLAGAQVRKLQR